MNIASRDGHSAGVFELSEKQSKLFALLSGDYNPMHLDPIYARRLQFGKTVVHGIHHLLAAWNECINDLPSSMIGSVIGMSAQFKTPVSNGDLIQYCLSWNEELGIVEVETQFLGVSSMTFTVNIDTSKTQLNTTSSCISDSIPIKTSPSVQEFPPQTQSGECEILYSRAQGAALFPALDQYVDTNVLAFLMVTTNIVGMQCPGLHSIYAGFEFEFHDGCESTNSSMRYKVKRIDQRVNLLDIDVRTDYGNGVINSFYRPPPVAQPHFNWISDRVRKDEFKGQKALIVGGTRGIGETAAKTIAAGGGSVVITYFTGYEDAVRVSNEINDNGGKCSFLEYDIKAGNNELQHLDLGDYSQIYFLASPRIAVSTSTVWDDDLYMRYCSYYISAFSVLLESCINQKERQTKPLTVFYPSTSFINDTPKGFYEYAAAKSAGEMLCKKISANYKNVNIVAPRLPRLNTDQTIGLIKKNTASVFEVIYSEMKEMC